MGLLLSLVAVLVSLIAVYAWFEASSVSGSITARSRAAVLRSIVLVGESALNEAVIRLNCRSGGEAWQAGSGSQEGTMSVSEATRCLWGTLRPGVEIGPVQRRVVFRPSSGKMLDPWVVELSVHVRASSWGPSTGTVGRRISRRYMAVAMPAGGASSGASLVLLGPPAHRPLTQTVEES